MAVIKINSEIHRISEEVNEYIDSLIKEKARLKEVIKGALRISDLWTLKEVEPMFENEAKALEIMKTNFEQALKGG